MKEEDKIYKTTAIHWKSETEYYDIDTGDQITKHNATHNYITIKTEKNVRLNEQQTHGTIRRTIQCKRNPQRELNFPD